MAIRCVTWALAVVVAALTAVIVTLGFGPLNPPGGAVSPTYKTLGEIEPRIAVNAANTPGDGFALYRITQPGSYYLTQNISVPATTVWGISIEAAGATLDLRGFTINGAGNDVGGISVRAAGVTVRNGSITGVSLTGIGVNTYPTGAPGLTVEDVRVIGVQGANNPGPVPGAGRAGIFGGRGAIIRNCYVNDSPYGIAAGYNSNITGCTVEFARQTAFIIEGGAKISDCVAVGTAGGPTDGQGFVLGAGTAAINCVSRSNAGVGFVTGAESVLTGCSSTNNTRGGFLMNDNARLERCLASSNGSWGVRVPTATALGFSIEGCSITSNANGGILVESFGSQGRIHGNHLRGTGASGTGVLVGVQIDPSCIDVAITENRIGGFSKAVQLDGAFCRVTGNAFSNNSGAISTSANGAPDGSNLVGELIGNSVQAVTAGAMANTNQ